MPPTVADYVLARLADLGIDRVFGVPGDYAFPCDDAIDASERLAWILCANELNAAYAADGYARIKGAAILSTTYGVGELSALNGVMGAKAQRLPVFHLVGGPSTRIQRQRLSTHHTLGDGVFGNFQALSAAAACVSAELTPDNVVDELERVIREAFRLSAPAYITVPMDLAKMPIVGSPVTGVHLSSIKRSASSEQELAAALAFVLEQLRAAQHPVALSSQLVARYGLVEPLLAFLDRSGMAFAVTPMDKAVVSEAHPNYRGCYSGQGSSPVGVQQIVEEADLILDIGGVLFEDFNTSLWSQGIDPRRLLTLGDRFVRMGETIFANVMLRDMLTGLTPVTPQFSPPSPATALAPLPLLGSGDEMLSSASFYPRLQRMLRGGDCLVIETGTCMMHAAGMLLPDGVGYESQTLWGSIGWATPAAMGVCMARHGGRTILVTGDGAHQLTANELGVMGRYGIAPIIFVLNNGIYGAEDVLNARGHTYDDLAAWNYHQVPSAMGCDHWLTVKAATVAELERAIADAQSHADAAYIEVMIPRLESEPLPPALQDRVYKTATPGSVSAVA
ncbi:alpha-keto acid decarboxylase family protein [Candidatus Thiodictyon syntrophicum]|jgi:indolepyruvate decarboxylase|uniref:Indolepyruvate decarboxylase n=1 Tax=Candidatus Thiodictyon syntrophicum TaxID=1166950 RepID=A0A2K8U9G0_9GAMM|nr:thiamine pyrophosphate-binding protein [Candidatus Thiodictyon syntrophicum]AUB82220.1 indolepyruvate decarboxylase [Candidatus Thiodictyon syntrophicum]